MNDERKVESDFSLLKGYQKAMPIIFAALAAFSAVCVFSKGSGFLGDVIGQGLRGLFSIGGYILPFLLGIHAVCYAADKKHHRFIGRFFFTLTATVLASTVEYAVSFWSAEAVFAPIEFYTAATSGGLIGSFIGFCLMKLIGHVGVIVFAAAILAIYAIFFYADRTGEFGQKALDVAEAVFGFLAKTEGDVKKKIADKKNEKTEREEEEHRSKSDELLNDSFFSNGGVDNLRIDELGIGDEPEPDPIVEDPIPQRKRRNPQKPVDLDYGIDTETAKADAAEDTFAAPKAEPAKNATDIFGIEDSAEKVFTKDFDPFDFATGEKVASKPSSKATFEVEIDELTMLELKGEPTEKEKRMMELEQRKKMWLERKKATGASSGSSNAPTQAQGSTVAEAASPVSSSAQTAASPARVESAPSIAPAPISATPTETPKNAPVKEEISFNPEESTPQRSTVATYNPPIKTVEFTINGGGAPTATAPTVNKEFTTTFEKSGATEKSAEDVAVFIAEKIARSNPAYARSANEMRTYMKITPSPEEAAADKETFEIDGLDGISLADKIMEEARNAVNLPTDVNGSNIPTEEQTFEMQNEESNEASAHTSSYGSTEDDGDSFFPASDSSESKPESSDPLELETAAILGLAGEGNGTAGRASYERAASFMSGINYDDTETTSRNEAIPVFKPYEPLVNENSASEPAVSQAPKTETITLERSMLTPSVPTVSEPASEESAFEVFERNSANTFEFESQESDEQSQTDDTSSIASASDETSASAEVYTFETDENEPTYTVVDETTSWAEEADEPILSTSEGIDWESDDNATEVSSEAQPDSAISFAEEAPENFELEEDDDSDEETPPESFNEVPEEDDATIEEIPPEEQNPDVIEMRKMFPFLTPIGEKPVEPATQENADTPSAENLSESTVADDSDDEAPPFDDAIIKESPTPVAVVATAKEEKEEKKAKKADYSNYEFPPIELLAKEEAFTDENIQAEIQENADKLIETLASFGVTASIKGVDRGPRITRYEVVPAKGVKVSSILNLQDDIALNLAAGSIRMEAPIPGKSAVGIEIPNKKSSTVRLRDLLETEEFAASKSKTVVCIGRDVAGQPVLGDISKMPHLLIAGATGMGKSVCINSLMISMLYKAKPDEVKFIMIDPKQVEFTMYNGIPHLLVPVVSDAKQAAGALMWAVEEMERRYNLLNPLCVRNVEAYNEKVTADPSLGEPMSKIVIVIDEFADLMLQVKDPVENLVMRIAQKARAAGIHLIIGTQRPSVNVITGVIKANVPSRISCKVMSNVDSKTVLDSAGAEKLLDRGDMLFAPAGSPKPHRVQGAFVADGEVESIMAHLKKFSDGANYDSSVMEEIERAAQKCSKKGGGNSSDYDDGDDEVHGEGYLNDRQFLDAVEVAVNSRKISTSLIQRKLSIGYGKAAKFIDIMEDMGIVSEANGQRPREVLISPDEWREKLARATLD